MRIELLPNGFYRLYDYKSKMSALFNTDGTARSLSWPEATAAMKAFMTTKG